MPDNPLRVVVDTNVVLDLLLNREPFVQDALQVFALGEAGHLELLLSTDAVTTIFYIVAKNRDAAIAREAVTRLLGLMSLAVLDEPAVLSGLALDFEDVEDAMVAAVAAKSKAWGIVTRNVRDFAGSPVPAMTPQALLAAWGARAGR